jgi:hypothetical protein
LNGWRIRNAAAQSARPYAGLQARSIKALSAEQIADLKAGRGMSLALAAELNGYPGPRHVLELGEQLSLTELDRLFARRVVTQPVSTRQRPPSGLPRPSFARLT